MPPALAPQEPRLAETALPARPSASPSPARGGRDSVGGRGVGADGWRREKKRHSAWTCPWRGGGAYKSRRKHAVSGAPAPRRLVPRRLRHVEGRRASPLDGDAVHEAQLRLAVALSPLRARLVSRGEADHTEEGAAPAPLRAPAEARCRSVRLQ